MSMRLFDMPPSGRCCVERCTQPATKWIGVISEHGRTRVRKAAAVCEHHHAQAQVDEELRRSLQP